MVNIGRRKYLFADADNGEERAATIYMMIGTAKPNGVDPETELHHLQTYIGDHPSTGLMIFCSNLQPEAAIEMAMFPNYVTPSLIKSHRHAIRRERTFTVHRITNFN